MGIELLGEAHRAVSGDPAPPTVEVPTGTALYDEVGSPVDVETGIPYGVPFMPLSGGDG